MAKAAHECVDRSTSSALCNILLQPLSKCRVEGFVLRSRYQPRLFDQALFCTQSDILHRRSVCTTPVYPTKFTGVPFRGDLSADRTQLTIWPRSGGLGKSFNGVGKRAMGKQNTLFLSRICWIRNLSAALPSARHRDDSIQTKAQFINAYLPRRRNNAEAQTWKKQPGSLGSRAWAAWE